MTTSSQSSQPEDATRETRAEIAHQTAHRTGHAADRYQSALERYLAVVAAEATEAGTEPPLERHSYDIVGDVMTKGTVAAHEEAVFKEIVHAIARNHISAVPVIDHERRVVGMVSESDLLTRVVGDEGVPPRGHQHHHHADVKRRLHAATARELMTSPAVTVTPKTTVGDAARIAARARVRRLPVVDDTGELVGIVTRADLLRVFLRDDAEIRREVEYLIRYGGEINPASVGIAVDEGVVTLTGDLERRLQAVRLIAAVRGVSGVVEVKDRLRCRIDDTRTPPIAPTMY